MYRTDRAYSIYPLGLSLHLELLYPLAILARGRHVSKTAERRGHEASVLMCHICGTSHAPCHIWMLLITLRRLHFLTSQCLLCHFPALVLTGISFPDYQPAINLLARRPRSHRPAINTGNSWNKIIGARHFDSFCAMDLDTNWCPVCGWCFSSSCQRGGCLLIIQSVLSLPNG